MNGNRFATPSTHLRTPPPPALRATSPRTGEDLPLLDKRGPGGVDKTESGYRHSSINAPAHSPSSGTSCHLPPGGEGAPPLG